MSSTNGQCIYTYTVGVGWTYTCYGCKGTCPKPPPPAWTNNNQGDPTQYTQLITDCSGQWGGGGANAMLVVDKNLPAILISLLDGGWTVRVKGPGPLDIANKKHTLYTDIDAKGTVCDCDDKVLIHVLPESREIFVRPPKGWAVNVLPH